MVFNSILKGGRIFNIFFVRINIMKILFFKKNIFKKRIFKFNIELGVYWFIFLK